MTDVHLQCHATDLTDTQGRDAHAGPHTHTPGPNTYMNWHKFKAVNKPKNKSGDRLLFNSAPLLHSASLNHRHPPRSDRLASSLGHQATLIKLLLIAPELNLSNLQPSFSNAPPPQVPKFRTSYST
ncbi:hypothetical protein FALCPG4_006388 [Fusarium falciforme]